jgi:hypothetical protein
MNMLNKPAEMYLHGIDDPLRRARVRKALEKKVVLNGKNPDSRADHAVRLYSEGYRVRMVRDKIRLVAPNGTFFEERNVTKTLCDFVVYLEHFDPYLRSLSLI